MAREAARILRMPALWPAPARGDDATMKARPPLGNPVRLRLPSSPPSRPSAVRRAVWLLLVVAVAALPLLPLPTRAAGPCDPPIANPIVCENSKPGNPASEWDVSGAGDSTIQGFATEISATPGQAVSFKVKTTASSYRIDIYRLGYYGGAGARKVATVTRTTAQTQPNCLTQSATGLVDCGSWAVSLSWTVPADAVSGIYVGRLVRTDNGGASHIPFVVRDDTGRSDLLFQTSDTTWHAYNSYGGNSFYTGAPAGRSYKVSYNRPFNNRGNSGGPRESYLFNAEYPMVRWLERNGYSVSYTTGVDTDRRAGELLEHKIFLSVGHDEYWSGQQRVNVEAARAAGVHLAFFSGNEVFWKTRWEASIATGSAPYRTLVSYKETHANAKIDPTSAWTGTWRDPRFSPPSDGGKPENALTGTLFMVNGPNDYRAMTVPAEDRKMRFWRNSSVANLPDGQVATLSAGCDCLVGYEWDEDRDNGFRPAGLIRLSATTADVPAYLQDYGTSYAPGTATHHLTLYRHASGALVFGAGTVDWAHGLDGSSTVKPSTPEPAVQQATVNLFADMGVQPGTLQAGLQPATASTDTAAPSSTITGPLGGNVESGITMTVTGAATDNGGQVGGVEVSVDGGATWHPATGRSIWSYSWTPGALGSTTIKSRATDDSGNTETPGAGVTVSVVLPSGPAVINFNDRNPSNVPLNGQYPTSVVDWGTNRWYLSAPWGQFTTNSISFAASGITSQTMTFVTSTPRRLVSVRAFNGGGSSTTVSLSCSGQPTKTQPVGAGQTAIISTGWANACTPVTLGSSNGWDTNFDDITHDAGTPDTVGPMIGAVQATSITTTSATVTWTTNEAADRQVEYGTTGYGSAAPATPGTPLATSHSVPLSGLTPNTLYHYRVKSRDAAGNLTTSDDLTFTTAAPDTTPPAIGAVQATSITTTSATVSWTTNEAADRQVEYGPTTAYGTVAPATPGTPLSTSHSVPLSGLTPNTLYHYRVKSKDAASNLATSDDLTFTTAVPSTSQTVTFDEKAGQDQPLNGQYPTGVIDWGTGKWYHSGPWGAFTTKSASFNGAGVTSQTFTFLSPRRLVSVRAYNGAGAATTVTIACDGQTQSQSVSAGTAVVIMTGFSAICNQVTLSSANGWDTNFDDLVHDAG
jgi:hypothetical protein